MALVKNESALLHRMGKVKVALLGQFTFRTGCVEDSHWQSRLGCTVPYGGHSQLMGLLLSASTSTGDVGVALSWQHGTADLSPHRQTRDSGLLAPFHPLAAGGCVRVQSTAHPPLLLSGSLCHWSRPLRYVSHLSQMPSVLCGSVLFLSCALCAHLGRRRCLNCFLCGRQCVSVAVFARRGAGGRRLTAPTVVLQAPG